MELTNFRGILLSNESKSFFLMILTNLFLSFKWKIDRFSGRNNRISNLIELAKANIKVLLQNIKCIQKTKQV